MFFDRNMILNEQLVILRVLMAQYMYSLCAEYFWLNTYKKLLP